MTTDTALQWAKVDSVPGAQSETHALRRPCPICGSDYPVIIQQQRDYQFFSDGPAKRMDLTEVQCAQCFALYKNPTYSPEGMRVLFAEAGQSYGHGGHAQQQVDWLKAQGLLENRTSVLDVGCGAGRFLSLMPREWTRLGIEPDLSLLGLANRGGVQVVAHDTSEPWTVHGKVDLITMWHVLEHVPDPVATLKQLRELAYAPEPGRAGRRDRTRLVIEVPIIELGPTPDITGFLSPQHTTHFSKRSLDLALRRSGWIAVRTEYLAGYNGCRVTCAPWDVYPMTNEEWAHEIFALDNHLYTYQQRQAKHLQQVELRTHQLATSNLVIWGAGMHTESLYHRTSLFQAERHYLLVDSDPNKQGTTWRGIPVLEPKATLPYINWAETQLLISSYGDQNVMYQNALELGVPASRIVLLYDPQSVRCY